MVRPTGDSPGAPSAKAAMPNALTVLRAALVPVIVALLFVGGEAARWAAAAIFAVAAVTDSLDGWVARRYRVESRWGKLADPVADKVLIIGSLGALAWLGELPWWAVAVIVAREVAVTVQRQVLLGRGLVMPASVFGKAKTVSQVVAVTLYLVPSVPQAIATVALWIAVVLTVASGLEYALRGEQRVRDSQAREPGP